ncbi:unnamed protein product, partial [Rotaria magnacalcarata]
MDRIELEQDYFTKYFNDIDDNDVQYIELHYEQQQQQQRLSQRLSQLSMTNQTDDDDGDNSIPKY